MCSELLAAIAMVAAIQQARPARAVGPPPVPAAATADIARGESALRASDWTRAISFFASAQKVAPLAPAALVGLGTAHGRAGHDLAAIAWLRTYLAVTPAADTRRSQVLDSIVRLQVAAETRIKRTLDEGAEALRELGPLDAATERAALSVALRAALVSGNTAAEEAVTRAAPETDRDMLWAGVAEAFVADQDVAHASQATMKIGDAARRANLDAAIQVSVKASSGRSLAERWALLARQLSERPEIVDLDRTLAEIGRAAPRDIPIRLLELGSRLGGAYERIRQLSTR